MQRSRTDGAQGPEGCDEVDDDGASDRQSYRSKEILLACFFSFREAGPTSMARQPAQSHDALA